MNIAALALSHQSSFYIPGHFEFLVISLQNLIYRSQIFKESRGSESELAGHFSVYSLGINHEPCSSACYHGTAEKVKLTIHIEDNIFDL